MEIAKFWGVRTPNPQTPEPTDKKFGVGDYVGDNFPHAKNSKLTPHLGRGGVCILVLLLVFGTAIDIINGHCHLLMLLFRIYVDAVINHMCGAGSGSGTGSAGSSYNCDTIHFPAVPYGSNDFHCCNCGQCSTSSCNIESYGDANQVETLSE